MGAVDPSYPLYPIANILSAVMLLLVLTSSFIRQSWNLGVVFLCFWLFFENLFSGIDSILWSDNSDIKLHVYCDIDSHVQLICATVKPIASFLIVRRLHLITRLRTVELPSAKARRNNLLIEWTFGLVIPLIVAGPFYYIVQGARFAVLEGFGCTNAQQPSVLTILLIQLWNILPPLVSVIFYYPQVAWTLYHQNKDVNEFLHSNKFVSRTNYFRILALASIDILLNLPFGIVSLVLEIKVFVAFGESFYPGWTYVHSNWGPQSLPYADAKALGTSYLAQTYFSYWTSPVLAFFIFGLFGLSAEARTSYWKLVCAVGEWFGWKPAPPPPELDDMKFGTYPQEISLDAELGSPEDFVNLDLVEAAKNKHKDSAQVESDGSDTEHSDARSLSIRKHETRSSITVLSNP